MMGIPCEYAHRRPIDVPGLATSGRGGRCARPTPGPAGTPETAGMMHATKLANAVLVQDIMRGYYIQSGVTVQIADREAYRRRFHGRAVAALGNMMQAPSWQSFARHAITPSDRLSLSVLSAFSFFKREILAKCIEIVARRLERGDRIHNPFAMMLSLAGHSRRALCAQNVATPSVVARVDAGL